MCDDLILDQCPDPYSWLIDTVEDCELKNCTILCDEPIHPDCKSFVYTTTTKVCQLYSRTIDSYMNHCAKFGAGADTVGTCLTDDSKYPDPCKVNQYECISRFLPLSTKELIPKKSNLKIQETGGFPELLLRHLRK